jgi:hypothetical protein
MVPAATLRGGRLPGARRDRSDRLLRLGERDAAFGELGVDRAVIEVTVEQQPPTDGLDKSAHLDHRWRAVEKP